MDGGIGKSIAAAEHLSFMMEDGARLLRSDVVNELMRACDDEPDKAVNAVMGMPVTDYGPATVTIKVDELARVAGNLAWLRGFIAGAKIEDVPQSVYGALDALDRWAGRDFR